MKQKYSKMTMLMVAGLAFLLTGMTSRKATNIPIPTKNYHVTIIDHDGYQTEGQQVSIDGEVYFSLRRGSGDYFISFDKIAEVTFSPAADNWVNASMQLVDATDPVDGQVDGLLPCYGETSFGKFELKLKNISKITFKH